MSTIDSKAVYYTTEIEVDYQLIIKTTTNKKVKALMKRVEEIEMRKARKLVAGLGVYITLRMLTSVDMNSKPTPTGLMRGLVSVWYSSQRLAGSCATDINPNIRTTIYSELTMWRVLLSSNCNYY